MSAQHSDKAKGAKLTFRVIQRACRDGGLAFSALSIRRFLQAHRKSFGCGNDASETGLRGTFL